MSISEKLENFLNTFEKKTIIFDNYVNITLFKRLLQIPREIYTKY